MPALELLADKVPKTADTPALSAPGREGLVTEVPALTEHSGLMCQVVTSHP